MNKYEKPNFLIVGAAKAGTTSLAKYLNEHPDIFIPDEKELRFFVADIIKTINKKDPQLKGIIKKSILNEAKYFKKFEVANKLAGEASVHYLYHHKTVIPKIKKYIGDIPIIIILRDPVDRAISNWRYTMWDSDSFEKSLLKEKIRTEKNFNSFWYYKDLGFYYEQVKAYKENFSKVKVLIFEEFKDDVQGMLNELFDFFQIPKIQISISAKIYNKRDGISPKYLIRNRVVIKYNHLIYSLLKSFRLEKIFFKIKSNKIDPDLKNVLANEYLDNINNLELLLDKDLSCWKMKRAL